MHVDSRIARRLAIVGVCALSIVVCCGLAWWQWERFSSAGGSFQNLGYVLQWPLFGLFPAFAFWRIRKLSQQAAQREAAAPASDGPEVAQRGKRTASGPVSPQAVARMPAVEAHDEDDADDAELAAYNRYLARLHAADQQDS